MSVSILYDPSLNAITGGITSSILMTRLEFWFSKSTKNCFYKFMAPCEHEAYLKGDSWTEELGFSAAEFRTAFKRIGVIYKSKKAFTESPDPFKGKPYLSYFDRIRKLTYYMRNDAFFKFISFPNEQSASRLNTSACATTKQSDNLEAEQSLAPLDVSSPANTDSASGIALNNKKLLNTQKESENLLEDSSDSLTPFSKILELLKTYCPSLCPVMHFTEPQKTALAKLWQASGSKLSLFEKAFKLVDESDFLSGRLEGHPWHATLDWLFKQANFDKVLSGCYKPFKKTPAPAPKMQQSSFFNIQEHNWNYADLEALEEAYLEDAVSKLPPAFISA